MLKVNKDQEKCECCKGSGTIRVLGGGGDYENWPCPECNKIEYEHVLASQYGCYDSEAE
jgi:hypothetical protein